MTPSCCATPAIAEWLLVGILLLLVGAVWALSLAHTIVLPVIAAGVIAAVLSPVVSWLARHKIPRGVGGILVLLAIMAVGVGLFVVVVAGIASQSGDIGNELADAQDKLAGWLEDVGVDPGTADKAKQDAGSTTSSAFHALVEGAAKGIAGLTSLVFFLSLTALSLVFLLIDGPKIRAWTERHLGVPAATARTITGRTLESLRGYFFGVTIVAVFNAVVVSLGALALDVPLAGTIAAVTFLGAYMPYLGAWSAGAFSVLIALGGAGPEAALGMAVVAAARQRRPPADGPADRLRGGARHPSARR